MKFDLEKVDYSIQKYCHRLEKWFPWLAIALIVHMFYKVPIDCAFGGIFNITFLLAICLAFALYFTKAYTGKRSRYVLVSFALYALYIIALALTDGDFTLVKRGVYEYGFFQAILFAAAFLVTKGKKENLVKAVVVFGLPFVLVGVLQALTIGKGSDQIISVTDNAMRITGWARSPLSLGMLSGIYCVFAFAQARTSRSKWYWIPLLFGVGALLVSGSRGPLVATFAAFAVYLLIEIVTRMGKKAIKPIGVAALVAVILAVIFFTSNWTFSNPEIQAIYIRLKRIVDWNGDAGNVGRLETWSKWFEVFLDHFWFGIGMSRTGSWSAKTMGVTESGFLRHLVELGIIGSILYYNLIAACIVTSVSELRKAKRELDHFMLLNLALVVLVLVEDMVLQITEEITVAFFLWWCLGALLGVCHEEQKSPGAATKGSRRSKRLKGKKRMSISIVMTTYNGAKFVEEQLDSLRWQTRQPDEVLIFDDCSKDNTPEIVANYIQKHQLNNWTFVVNEKNKGWKENFKDGLLMATGDLVFPADQDDIWRKDKLAVCEQIMKENSNILVLTSNYEKFGDCKQEIVPYPNNKQIVQIPFEGNLFRIFFPGCSYCIRNSFLKDIEKNWTPNSPHDATIWRYALIRDGLYALNDNLLLWRVYNTSTFEVELVNNRNREKKRQWLDYAMGVLNDMDDYLSEHEAYRTEQVAKAMETNKKFLSLRMDLYDRVNIVTGLKLLAYLKYYAAPIQYLGDWLHVLRK